MVTNENQITFSQEGRLYKCDLIDVTTLEFRWRVVLKCLNTGNFTKRKKKKNLELTMTRKIGGHNEFKLL